jgi:hypothetical protein
MAKFFVGQRVRIKYSKHWPELAGKQGTIIRPSRNCGREGLCEWEVAPDCWGSEVAPTSVRHCGCRFAPNSSQLEPIQDKPELSSWEALKNLGLDIDHIKQLEHVH